MSTEGFLAIVALALLAGIAARPRRPDLRAHVKALVLEMGRVRESIDAQTRAFDAMSRALGTFSGKLTGADAEGKAPDGRMLFVRDEDFP